MASPYDMFLNAYYDKEGKPVFEGGDPIMSVNQEGFSRPSISVEMVKARLGEDSGELYARALEREFTADDYSFAEFSNENNEALKSLLGWTNLDDFEGSAKYFVREIELYFEGEC